MKQRNTISRRDALRYGVGGAVGAAMAGSLTSTAFGQVAIPAPTPKLLVIFMRGGLDGISMVTPTGDTIDYNTTNRPNIHIPPTGAQVENTGYAHLHPSMGAPGTGQGVQPMLTAGKILFLHRVGLTERTGSHFEDQRTCETGITPCSVPFGFDKEEGWVTRLNERNIQLPFAGASVGTDMAQFFQTQVRSRVMPHIRRVWRFPDDGAPAYTLDSALLALDAKYRGQSAASAPPFGYGMTAHMAGTGYAAQLAEPLNRGVGTALLDSEAAVGSMIAGLPGGVYVPGGGATYPFDNPTNQVDYPNPTAVGLPNTNTTKNFMAQLRDSVAMLKHTDARIASVDLASFDTHNTQGGATGALSDLFKILSHGLQAVWLDSQSDLNLGAGLVTLVLTEFGRTSKENGSGGTDHGGASVAIAMGARVRTQANGDAVLNCNAATFPNGATLFSAAPSNLGCNPAVGGTGHFILPRTHTYTVLEEALVKLFGSTPTDLAQILPGYTPGAAPQAWEDPAIRTQLNYLL